ncbi:MAG: His/Gly/Thr/Pro-type tRNA ligase C-terminal domain-containing protein, partial [Chloroflexota bacterium]
ELIAPAREVLGLLKPRYRTEYDQTGGNIGRRYRRQDEIGTPFCITVDFETLEDRAVTIRERDSMEQERVPIEGLVERLAQRFAEPVSAPGQ